MEFEYGIDESDYRSAQLLYHKLSRDRRRLRPAAIWGVVGALFFYAAWIDEVTRWSTVLLALIGVFCIFCGFTMVFQVPSGRSLHRGYRDSELAGKKHYANVDESGIEVHDDLFGWTARWAGVRRKGENGQVFIFCAEGRIFIFPKRLLTGRQQEELRQLSGLTAPSSETQS